MPERRRRNRLPWVSMNARVKVRKGLLGSQWLDVEVVDFSKLGMGIVMDREPENEKKMQLSLRLDTEVGDITVDQVSAYVRHVQGQEKGTFIGLEFEEDLGQGVQDALKRIEGILERHQSLSDRLS